MSAGQGSGALPDLVASQLYTAVVSDILDDLGHRDHVLDPAIRPLGRAEVIVGPANPFLVTEVRQIPAEPYAGEIGALDDVRLGEVILVVAGGSARAACWGELFSTAARARGARGTLIDGYCRDARSIADLGYPVWCRGMLPLDCKGRTAVTAWRQPAVVGGLPVRPGDLVVADADGAVVVPAELIDQTIRQALTIRTDLPFAAAQKITDMVRRYTAGGVRPGWPRTRAGRSPLGQGPGASTSGRARRG